MSDKVQVDQLNTTIQKILNEYTDDVEDIVTKTIDSDAKEAKKIVQDHAPVGRTGSYKKNITVRKEKTRKGLYKKVVHVKDPDYRLSHLLEYQHLTRDGTSKTSAHPHFKFGEEYLDKNFEKDVRENIEKNR